MKEKDVSRQRKWQLKNGDKHKAQSKAFAHTNLRIVLYECLHRNQKKENHHPDYRKWREVFRVCHKCHCQFHLNSFRKPKKELMETKAYKKKQKIIQERIAAQLALIETAKRIFIVRKLLGLSQYDFSVKIRQPCPGRISNWEKGKHYPTRKYLERIESLASSIERAA